MTFALASGVTGLQSHQRMLDVAGNNLANVNTTAFKSSRIGFHELLSETIQKASQPTSTVGGTNPQQMGTGVGIASIIPDMTQGNLVNTGNPLDLSIEGEGYFVVNDGEQDYYTRAGSFAVDANANLVDPSTGYLVQRIGSVGESDDFQTAGDSNIHVPYDVAMPANGTTEITVTGNLSSDATFATTQTQVITSSTAYTYDDGTAASLTTELDALDQYTGTLTSGTLTFAGYDNDGTALSGAGLTMSITGSTTMGDVIDHLNNNLVGSYATASLVNGRIRITDDTAGYSKSDLSMSYSGDGTLTTPSHFEYTTVGGEEVKNLNITIYDTQGGRHVMSGAFVRTDTLNTWDMVLSNVTTNVNSIDLDDRRISGISFDATLGSYNGLTSGGTTGTFTVTFDHDTSNAQEITINMGTVGQLDGLTQYAGNSTAVANEQDGYEAGRLSTVSVDNEGTLIGAFSNGIKRDIAVLEIALFQNTAALERVGSNYFIASANSGEAVSTQALSGGAGTVHGSSLEKSNADVATEFVNMIQAQNGFQANARTIRVANEILRELTTLIR